MPKKTNTQTKKQHTSHRDQLHQDIYDFFHTPWKLALVCAGAVVVLLLIVQVFYPADRALPFVTVAGERVDGQTEGEITEHLQNTYADQPITFSAGEDSLEADMKKIGAQPRYRQTSESAVHYTWWQRMLPFSLVWMGWLKGDVSLAVDVDDTMLTTFVKDTLLPLCQRDAASAKVATRDGELVLVEGHAGRECEESDILEAVRTMSLSTQRQVELPFAEVPAKRGVADVQDFFDATKQRLEQGITVVIEDEEEQVPLKTLVSWLVFEEDSESGELKLAVDEEKISSYVHKLHEKYSRPAESTTIYLRDGDQQDNEGGAEGRQIDGAAAIERLSDAVTSDKTRVEVPVSTIAPDVQYVRDYSPTQKGLEVLLQDLAREKGGYGLTVIELDGKQRRADADGNRSFTTASTFKIFVAYAVLKEIEAGRMSWNQHIRDGMDTTACWEEMLTYSLNPCAYRFAQLVGGWGHIEAQMRQHGLVNTQLNDYDKRSTPNDEALYFAKLERGELLQGASRERLINTLLHQHYKSGIPAGTGTAVANKIGFYSGYLHDIGIVYGPNGRYVLAVMTQGGSWGGIADVASRVHEFMQR